MVGYNYRFAVLLGIVETIFRILIKLVYLFVLNQANRFSDSTVTSQGHFMCVAVVMLLTNCSNLQF